jgi:hypothetical protein
MANPYGRNKGQRIKGSKNTPVHGAVDSAMKSVDQHIKNAAGIPSDVDRNIRNAVGDAERNVRKSLGDLFGWGKKSTPKPRPKTTRSRGTAPPPPSLRRHRPASHEPSRRSTAVLAIVSARPPRFRSAKASLARRR